jgi:uncharacterized protein YyaL (SSP411 family)
MNHLATEKSPYLLQHKDNPVDWYPWCEEAFVKAKAEDKPVFLSIGYATCHWCHVMAHESFEDEGVAQLMNEAFINIKVDREERPDIDNTYMTVCQMLTGQGGWPLTIVMTPEKEPFYAATYLPKHSRQNRIGMMEFVPAIQKAWETDRANVMNSVERINEGFTKTLELGRTQSDLPDDIFDQAQQSLSGRFDRSEGGFGSAPKFPSPHNLLFLLNRYKITHDEDCLNMVKLTLKKMRLGGLWDHVGFGFHRYSTDARWLLPHFEKMLYDQAMLLMAYTEAWEITQQPLFKETVYNIIDYVDECMTDKEGAFYSAEDADSEGEEGKFYVWETGEIRSILSADEAEMFLDLYQFEEKGNFRDEATHQKTGKNIPHLKHELTTEEEDSVNNILKKLKTHREKRVRPQLDDKILTDWNGLMIAALARAGQVFDEQEFVQKAENAWAYLKDRCFHDGELLHRVKDGDAAIKGMADDYAFTIWGLVELYQATQNHVFLEKALKIQAVFDREFWDDEFGGYYFTASEAEKLLGRQKEIYDGAIPSSNSVALRNLYHLSRLTGESGFEERAEQLVRSFSVQVEDAPAGYTFVLDSFQLLKANSVEVVITAQDESDEVMKMIKTVKQNSPPGSVILLKTDSNRESLKKISPFTESYPTSDTPAVYICKNFACKAPVYSVEGVIEALKE